MASVDALDVAHGEGRAVSVLLGLGSNLGDRAAHIRRALELLEKEPGIQVLRVSTLRETDPVGGPPQGPYLNGAAELRTDLDPSALLGLLHRIEAALGRVRSVPSAPRQIDLDLLLYGDRQLKTDVLEIPHPRVLERVFVLEPLCEIAPERIHPCTGRTLREHLEALRGRQLSRSRAT